MSALVNSLEMRGILAMTEAIIGAARKAHEAGDDALSVWLYDRSQECCDRLRLLERIDAERALFRVLPLTPNRKPAHV
jgi:hypothetical protein